MKKLHTEQLLEKYLYDINILDNLYITLDNNKIDFNVKNYKQYSYDVIDIENTKYYMVTYKVGENTILTIIESLSIMDDKEIINSQFLIKSKKALYNLKISDLTKHIDYQIADLVIGYLE